MPPILGVSLDVLFVAERHGACAMAGDGSARLSNLAEAGEVNIDVSPSGGLAAHGYAFGAAAQELTFYGIVARLFRPNCNSRAREKPSQIAWSIALGCVDRAISMASAAVAAIMKP